MNEQGLTLNIIFTGLTWVVCFVTRHSGQRQYHHHDHFHWPQFLRDLLFIRNNYEEEICRSYEAVQVDIASTNRVVDLHTVTCDISEIFLWLLKVAFIKYPSSMPKIMVEFNIIII